MQHKTRIILWSLAGFLLFIVAVVVSFIFCYGPPDTHQEVLPEDFDRRFTPAELQADLDFMLSTFEQVHPDLYFYTKKHTIVTLKDSLAARLSRPMTRVQFYSVRRY